MEWSIFMIVIGILLVVLLAAAIIINRRYRTKPNYKIFFIIGITWIPLGIATRNYVFSLAGIAMMILGLSKRKEWREEPSWKDLPPQVRNLKLIMIGVITVILIALLILLIFNK